MAMTEILPAEGGVTEFIGVLTPNPRGTWHMFIVNPSVDNLVYK
jgi:hypothetical protein